MLKALTSGLQLAKGWYPQRTLATALAAGLASLTPATTAWASTYFPEKMVCPVGGEKFEHMTLGSISTWGALPDGMPVGSGMFPIRPPVCPGNQLVLYREFKSDEIERVRTLLARDEYKVLRAEADTPYYLAYRAARALGDADALWLLLRATWEAKNTDPSGEQARRYNSEFLTLVSATSADAKSLDTIALRARAANAARELGEFGKAETLRSSISIASDAGGSEDDAAENRQGWTEYLTRLAAPIARKDTSREPIDMVGSRAAVFRCMAKELSAKYKQEEPAPLTPFEAD